MKLVEFGLAQMEETIILKVSLVGQQIPLLRCPTALNLDGSMLPSAFPRYNLTSLAE